MLPGSQTGEIVSYPAFVGIIGNAVGAKLSPGLTVTVLTVTPSATKVIVYVKYSEISKVTFPVKEIS